MRSALVSVILAVALSATRAYADGEIVAPIQLDAAPAPYPEGAHGDAVVVVALTIAKDGTVEQATVVEGEPPFAEAARLAALSFRFSPALRNGIPIRAKIRARVVFRAPVVPATAAPTSAPEQVAKPKAPSAPPPTEITVVGEEREELGSTHVPKSETRMVPGAFADPFRVVEVMPGVAPILSGLPYFFVRGAPPGDVGYYVDGIRVPLLFHVGAGPSILAPALVDRVDLFPSVYPTRFGRHAGGIMAGETTAPGTIARGEAHARIFDAGGMVEQPFAEGRGSVTLGGRYGYTGALLALVAPDYQLGYWDYQARVVYRVSDHHRVSVFAFGGFDRLGNEVLGRTLFDVQFHRVDLRLDHETERGRIRVATTLSSDRTLNASEDGRTLGSASNRSGLRVRLEIDQKLGNGLRVRGGGDVAAERFADDREQRGPMVVTFERRVDGYGGAWIDLVARHGVVEVVPGFRFDVYRTRGDTILAPEPRLATKIRVAEGLAWVSAFALTHQIPTSVVPVPGQNLSALETGPQEAWQASQSLELALPLKMLAKVTGFYSAMRTKPELADGTRLPTIEGRNYGAELFLRRDFTERLGGFLSYTLSRADRIAFGQRFPSSFDRTHVLSLVLGYDLGRGFRVGSRFFYMSARPYQVACPTPDCGPGAPELLEGPRPYVQSGRLAGFGRVDVRFEKRWTFGSSTWIAATLEWFNALLARETEYATWTPNGLLFFRRSALTLPSVGIEAGY